jgi:hypothetical protein
MRKKYLNPVKRTIKLSFLLSVCLLFIAPFTMAQTGGNYDLGWNTWDGGGGTSIGVPYELSGTIGQPDATTMIGVNYTLSGGFWPGVAISITPVVKENAWYLY